MAGVRWARGAKKGPGCEVGGEGKGKGKFGLRIGMGVEGTGESPG